MRVLLFIIVMLFSVPAFADCTNPASPIGGIAYGSAGDLSTMMACDGADWVPWAGWTVSGYPAPQYTSANTLNGLTDVDTTGFADGEILMYSAGAGVWVSGTAPSLWFQSGGDVYRSTGNVGIGKNNPLVALDVVGDINYTGQIVDVSDIRLKENVRPLQSPLKKLTSLNGIAFEMKGDPKHATEYGVSAQDVREVFPELVHQVDENGTLGVNYTGLIAPLIEAVKEQQAQIKALETEIKTLKARRDTETGEQ